jgi:ABC-2 type transport system permease protein
MTRRSTGLRALLGASIKMYYRSPDTVLFGALSPFLLLGIFALVQRLRFDLPRGAGSIDFFSFTAIGYAAFIAAHFNQDGVVGAASGYRAQGVLKRIAVTPISPLTFISAQVLTRVIVGVAQTLMILAAGIALGAHVTYTPDLLWIVPVSAVALLTGVSFAFAIAGVTSTPGGANQLNIGIFTPVFLLAGVQYPLQALSGALPTIAQYAVPFAAPVQAFRHAVAGDLTGDFARLILISLGWLLIASTLAVRSYRLVERDA